MKKITILALVLILGACKPNDKQEAAQGSVPEKLTEDTSNYPNAMMQVFDAHGGLELWKQQRTLSFGIPHSDNPETHTVDLWSRRDRVDSKGVSMGFDGTEIWLLDPESTYKGDAAFYHNLMFYFYAMPFVLADDGIVYNEADALAFEGKEYPGVRIAYESGVGVSSKDEYYIHFDPDTYQMAWLGYTVTYRTGEKSDNVKWIRYDDWQTVNGLVLPKSITWYNYEGNTILDPKSTVVFTDVALGTTPKPKEFYAKPEGAISVVAKKN
ncbi:MAG: DUF4292 domain-containing protein [Flavobacteriaceae bacterium]|uniref:DUF6503 family protein n=1 Tax=Flagellimonas sp. SN16 TaxID=3415142 RepID=UPI003C55A3EA|nr:DUF4292 domain-containing protein [Flavobacteriaceae bacterium]